MCLHVRYDGIPMFREKKKQKKTISKLQDFLSDSGIIEAMVFLSYNFTLHFSTLILVIRDYKAEITQFTSQALKMTHKSFQ